MKMSGYMKEGDNYPCSTYRENSVKNTCFHGKLGLLKRIFVPQKRISDGDSICEIQRRKRPV